MEYLNTHHRDGSIDAPKGNVQNTKTGHLDREAPNLNPRHLDQRLATSTHVISTEGLEEAVAERSLYLSFVHLQVTLM
ncbi:MAG TPA: hypothetical protein VFE38_00150 [Edaphobacter sp.]|nr:hypothetical protein [Edaphobacter sp.]